MSNSNYRTLMTAVVAISQRHLIMASAWGDGSTDEDVLIDVNGHSFSTKDLPASKPANAKKWAASKAIEYAKAHPEMPFGDVMRLADELYAWIESKPAEGAEPPLAKEGGTEFV